MRRNPPRARPMSERDMASRSKRLGGDHTFADVHRGPRTGIDGDIHRAVFGNSREEFDEIVKHEMAAEQRRHPDRFINKIAPRTRRKLTEKPCRT